ncbi:MAG: DUF370 domain-containing protein [Oscillospiraceae bacterium]|nr:DUF370 domain-containing protein [Oscillospiraceae bacterium]
MYIPIGGDMSLRSETIIAIFDLDNASWSYKTREFLRRAEENGEVVPITDELPKTMILTREMGLDRVWLSQFGVTTLQKRMEKGEAHG